MTRSPKTLLYDTSAAAACDFNFADLFETALARESHEYMGQRAFQTFTALHSIEEWMPFRIEGMRLWDLRMFGGEWADYE